MGLYLQGNSHTSMMSCRKGWHNFFDTNGNDLDCLVLLSSWFCVLELIAATGRKETTKKKQTHTFFYIKREFLFFMLKNIYFKLFVSLQLYLLLCNKDLHILCF